MFDILVILLTVIGLLATPYLPEMSLPWKVVYDVGCIAVGGAALFALRRRDARLRNSTRLVPGKVPRPVLPNCPVPKDAFLVLYGTNASWSTQMPHTVIEMAGDEMLTIDRAEDGKGMVVTLLRVFNDRDEIIARVHKDGFYVANARTHRPRASTLEVYDSHDVEVLYIELLNPTTLSVRGILRHKGRRIEITRDSAKMGGITMTGNCFGNNRVDISAG